jgi:ABC-type amino acid transport substrate-binding protein
VKGISGTLVQSLLTGQIDAAAGSVSDFSPYFKSADYADYYVAVQMKFDSAKTASQCQAVQLPLNSPNLAAVNAEIDKLRKDGKIDEWMSKYVVPAMGGVDLRTVPLVTISQ